MKTDPVPVLEVKGSSIRSKLAFVGERFGADAEAELCQLLAAQGVSQVLEANWYPFDLFEALLRRIAERHYGGDLQRLREVGRWSAKKALTGTYDFFLRLGSLQRFLEKIPVLHERYYSVGKLSVVSFAAGSCEMRLEGAPYYREGDLQVAAGFFTGVAELLGHRDVRCALHQRLDSVSFRLDWAA